jgi:trigger factor
MQVTETNAEGLKREFKVQIAADEIDEKMAGRLAELGTTVKVPGFRPGKVPLQILKQRFGKSVLGEILERAVSDSSNQALNERGLRPATQPKIEITAFDEGKDLEYTMELELLPDIEPMDFSKIQLERSNIEVEESAVQETIEDLAKAHKKTKPLEAPRKTRGGDVLVIDFSGTVDGEAYPGMAAEDHHLELGSSGFVEGFEDQLIGVDIGETREVKVTFPEAYVNDRLAGREAVFTVTLKNILESVPMAIDDELATTLGETDLEALRARIRERLGAEYKGFARARLKRQLLDRLAEGHEFPVPEGMVEVEFESIWRQIEQDREAGKLDPEDAEKSEDELKKDYREIAERRVRLGLLISDVGRLNGIEVTEEEANMALFREAQQYPGKEREVFEFYQKTPEAMANLRAPIFEDKVVDFIVDLADVTERAVTIEELRKEMEGKTEQGASEANKKPAKKSAKTKKAAKSPKEPDAKKKTARKKAAKERS